MESLSKEISERKSENSAYSENAKLLAQKNSKLSEILDEQNEQIETIKDEREKMMGEMAKEIKEKGDIKKDIEIGKERENRLLELNLELTSRLRESQAKEHEVIFYARN